MTRDELRDEIALQVRLAMQEENLSLSADLVKLRYKVYRTADAILSIPKIAEGIGMVVVKDISERT
jgi:hypothetical protein